MSLPRPLPLNLCPCCLPPCLLVHPPPPPQFPAACGRVAVLLGWSREEVEDEVKSRGVSHPYDILDEAQRRELMVSLRVCSAQRVLGCVLGT